jgi:hypothetical protein
MTKTIKCPILCVITEKLWWPKTTRNELETKLSEGDVILVLAIRRDHSSSLVTFLAPCGKLEVRSWSGTQIPGATGLDLYGAVVQKETKK